MGHAILTIAVYNPMPIKSRVTNDVSQAKTLIIVTYLRSASINVSKMIGVVGYSFMFLR